MYELDDLFTGVKQKPKPSRPTGAVVRPMKEPPKAKPATEYKGEGSPVRVKPKSEDPAIKEEICSGVPETLEKACGGNKYLEAMLLGEILNRRRGGRI